MTQATATPTLAEIHAELTEAVRELGNVATRVTRLEDLARRALPGHLVRELDSPVNTVTLTSVPVADPAPVATEATGPASNVNGNAPAVPGAGVDYAAVAFGLTDLKAKMESAVGRSAVANEYRGVCEWFAGCFAGDSAFDRAAFLRQCGV